MEIESKETLNYVEYSYPETRNIIMNQKSLDF